MILDHPQTKPQAGFLPRQGPQYALLTPLQGTGLPLAIVASLRASHAPQSTQAHPGGMLVPRSNSVSVSSPHRWVHAGARRTKRAARVAAAPSCDPGRHFVGAAINDRCLAVAQPCPASAPRRRLHGLARVGDGGQVLVYVVMASWPSGATAGRLYILTTQADGCVASFQGNLTSILPQEEA
jgi:hypothetical protein